MLRGYRRDKGTVMVRRRECRSLRCLERFTTFEVIGSSVRVYVPSGALPATGSGVPASGRKR